MTTDQNEATSVGDRTRQRLLVAALDVFAERGYHVARVDDIVRSANTSHGTFYLYFANKEAVLRELAIECGHAIDDLAPQLGAVSLDASGLAELARFFERFLAIYGTYGPVIRAAMEDHVSDRATNRLAVDAFTAVATSFARQLSAAGRASSPEVIGALMAMVERFAYFHATGRIDAGLDEASDVLATCVHQGFFLPVG